MSVGIWVYKDKIIGYVLQQGLYYSPSSNLTTMLYYPRYHPSSRGFLDDIARYYQENPEAWELSQQVPDQIALTHACQLDGERIRYVSSCCAGDYNYYALRDNTEIYTTQEEVSDDIYRTSGYRYWGEYDTEQIFQVENPTMDLGEWVDVLIKWSIIVIMIYIVIMFLLQVMQS